MQWLQPSLGFSKSLTIVSILSFFRHITKNNIAILPKTSFKQALRIVLSWDKLHICKVGTTWGHVSEDLGVPETLIGLRKSLTIVSILNFFRLFTKNNIAFLPKTSFKKDLRIVLSWDKQLFSTGCKKHLGPLHALPKYSFWAIRTEYISGQ